MIQINGTIRLAPGTVANSPETVDALVTMVKASRTEDGCLDYTFAQDLADADTLIIYERWRDEEALKAHFQSPHMAEFQKVMAANPPLSRNLRRYDTDDGTPL